MSCTLHVVDYCRFTAQSRSSVWLQFQHKLYPSQWFLKPTMLISRLHCLPLHSTQGKAECSTLSIMSMERCHFIVQVTLTIKPSTVHFNLDQGFIKNACRLYSKARGRGAPAVKKLVLLRRRTDVLLGRRTDVSNRRRTDVVYGRLARRRDDVVGSSRFYVDRRRRTTSSGPVHDVVTTSSRRRIFWRVHLACE